MTYCLCIALQCILLCILISVYCLLMIPAFSSLTVTADKDPEEKLRLMPYSEMSRHSPFVSYHNTAKLLLNSFYMQLQLLHRKIYRASFSYQKALTILVSCGISYQ